MPDCTVTMKEAADILGISSVKMWQLVRDGVVAARPNPLDRREKLIDVMDLQRLQGHARPRPCSIGSVDDLGVRSDEVDRWFEENWHPC